jgi:hypothetical protein
MPQARSRALNRAPAIALCAVLAQVTTASVVVADDSCPDSAGQEQAIVDGEVLIKLTDFPGSAAKEGCVLGYIAAAPEKVMAVLREAGEYGEYMPRVRSSRVAPGDGGVVLNSQELDLPWPIGDRHFTVRLIEKRGEDGAFRFDFDYVPGSGNIEDTRGHWLIEPWRNGSRVTYSLWTDPGGVIPMWAVNRASRRTLPMVIVALRDRVLDRPQSGLADDDEDV